MPTRREQETQRTPPKLRDAIQDAIEYGIDVSAIRDNLSLTPTQRLHRHEIALNMVEMLQKATRV